VKCQESGGCCVGSYHGFFHDEEVPSIVAKINASGANILVVGMGMPRQEFFISANYNEINASIMLNGGACFKYYTGELPSCPRFLAAAGFEWLYRLIKDPKRLWRRYVLGNPMAIYRVLVMRFKNRINDEG
jgi:N-acetylglucosaminyldiphosphoundecaprenol N-acetyl-beta-D-mannosaminyltransferase